MEKPVCLIVGAGSFSGFTEEINRDITYVIAADGGYRYLQEAGITPDLWVGDADSLSCEEREALDGASVPKMFLPMEKDDTDMLFAVRRGIEEGCVLFQIYGGCGGRFDHTFANIQVMSFVAKFGFQCYMYDGGTMMTVISGGENPGGITFPENASGYVSVFSLSETCNGVNLIGLKYEMRDGTLDREFPLGVSNEFTGRKAVISVKEGTMLIVLPAI